MKKKLKDILRGKRGPQWLRKLVYYLPSNVDERENGFELDKSKLRHWINQAEEEAAETRAKLLPVIDKLARARWHAPSLGNRQFRLVVDFSEHIVHDVFVHGYRDKCVMNAVACNIAQHVLRELQTLNFSRYRTIEVGDYDSEGNPPSAVIMKQTDSKSYEP